MSLGRKPLKDHVANNPQRAAEAILAYIQEYRKTDDARVLHQIELVEIFQAVQAAYNEAQIQPPLLLEGWPWLNHILLPLISLLGNIERYLIHPLSRQRQADLAEAYALMQACEHDDQFAPLKIVLSILQDGRVESTSANTILLDLLILKTQKFNSINEDHRISGYSWKDYGSRKGMREVLRDLLIEYGNARLEQREILLAEKERARSESKNMKDTVSQKLIIPSDFKEQLSIAITGRSMKDDSESKAEKLPCSIKQLDEEKYAEVRKKLEEVLPGIAFIQRTNLKSKASELKVKKLDEEKYADIRSALEERYLRTPVQPVQSARFAEPSSDLVERVSTTKVQNNIPAPPVGCFTLFQAEPIKQPTIQKEGNNDKFEKARQRIEKFFVG